MNFIDFHTHIYPEKIAVKATNFLRSAYDLPADWPGTAENLLIFGKAAGISKFVVLTVAVKKDQVRKINEFAVSQNNEYEELLSFGSIHAEQENLTDEIDFIRNSGLYGIKIHPEHQHFAIDDERLFPAYDYLQSLQFPILFHCGDATSNLSHPSRVKHLLQEFPKLNLVAAHFGGWQVWEEAFPILKDANCHFDMSSSQMFLGPKRTAEFINAYGAEKIFFGTDFPLWDQQDEIKSFLELPISDKDKELIAHLNAERFLKL